MSWTVRQAELKPEFTDLCLMIGQFHAQPPPLPGPWNEAFRPFYFPVPLLAVRHTVAGAIAVQVPRQGRADWPSEIGKRGEHAPRARLDVGCHRRLTLHPYSARSTGSAASNGYSAVCAGGPPLRRLSGTDMRSRAVDRRERTREPELGS